MNTAVIITVLSLLILSYIFDLSSTYTKIPSVILLLISGWLVKTATRFLGFEIPNLNEILPVLGTIGLILIVLEGSLELELNKTKLPLILKTIGVSILPMILFSVGLAYTFWYFGGIPISQGLVNAIPFGIISSAIAIPSVKHLSPSLKEFIIYESSLSDIFGVIFFNYLVIYEQTKTISVGGILVEILIVLAITLVSVIVLSFLLSKITHHVKFAPIIITLILIYIIAKEYHLPALIFIMMFGLFLGNLNKFRKTKIIEKLKPQYLENEVNKFKDLNSEMTFMVRALFFLLFGFLIEIEELLNIDTSKWAVGIIVSLYFLRFIFLKIMRIKIFPVAFIAPRGLITILLFLSIPMKMSTHLVNRPLIIQTIVATAFIMMFGLMFYKKEVKMELKSESNFDDINKNNPENYDKL